MDLFIYDTETSGKDKRFDQPFQYGIVRSTEECRPYDQFEVRCRPDRHILAHPQALLVTHMDWEDLMAEKLSHYEMMGQVAGYIENAQPAIFVGHNTIRYDEELQRQSLFKTLRDPYLTSKNGSGRLDTLYMARLAYVVDRDKFSWPQYEDGRPSFQLEKILPANGITGYQAHDAIGDVLGCNDLLNLMRERTPRIWDLSMKMAFRSEVDKTVNAGKPFLMLTTGGDPRLRPVVPVARNPDNRNEVICVDLDQGYDNARTDPNDVALFREDRQDTPFVKLRMNRAPMIVPIVYKGRDAAARYEKDAARITADKTLFYKGIAILKAQAEKFAKSEYIEDKLYDGFFPRKDEYLMERYHTSTPEERFNISRQFQDARLRTVASRLIHIEHPEVQPESMRIKKEDALMARLFQEEEVPWTTQPVALAATRELLASGEHAGDAEKTKILKNYQAFLETMERPEPAREPAEKELAR